MAFVVQEFKDSPSTTKTSYHFRTVCMTRREEVKLSCVGKSEEDPVVEAVDENSLEGH